MRRYLFSSILHREACCYMPCRAHSHGRKRTGFLRKQKNVYLYTGSVHQPFSPLIPCRSEMFRVASRHPRYFPSLSLRAWYSISIFCFSLSGPRGRSIQNRAVSFFLFSSRLRSVRLLQRFSGDDICGRPVRRRLQAF